MKKSELVDRMRATRDEFESLLAELEPKKMTRSDVAGAWSVKDILAHIAWYQREEADLFGETGVEASSLWKVSQDPRNEILFQQNRDRPLDEVLAEFQQAFDKLLAVVARLSDEDLNMPGRFPGTSVERPPWRVIAVHSFEHDREHIEMIRTWLERMQKNEANGY